MINIEKASPIAYVASNRDEASWLLPQVEDTLKKRRGNVNSIYGNNAVILMSGGMDSSVMVELLMQKTNLNLYPLFIRRGSRSQKWEEQGFDFFVEYYTKKYGDRFKFVKKLQIEVPPLDFKKYRNPEQLKTHGHPMRNVVLQSLAIQYASYVSSEINDDVRTVFVATVPDDSFPHSSLLALRTTSLLACIESGDWRWNVLSPLIDETLFGQLYYKADLIKFAVENNIPLEKTRTCIEASEKPCMLCPECEERIKAFTKAGVSYV